MFGIFYLKTDKLWKQLQNNFLTHYGKDICLKSTVTFQSVLYIISKNVDYCVYLPVYILIWAQNECSDSSNRPSYNKYFVTAHVVDWPTGDPVGE